MTISIIIPTLNEANNVDRLISYLKQQAHGVVTEIIVSDGGSCDDTKSVALAAGAKFFHSPGQGRAMQMNYGVSKARGDIFYFVHADSIPPATYEADILQAVNNGFDIGRYRTKFEGGSHLLKLNAFFTRFDWFVCYGGDQTLFITKEFFEALNGYDESLLIMEEYELTERAKKKGRYKILSKATLVSTRKYDHNSWWQVQKANYLVVKMYKRGVAQEVLLKRYNEMIKYR